MSDNAKPKIKWLDKLKNVKHIEIYIAIIFVVVLLLIFMSNSGKNSTSNKEINSELTVTEYVESLENNLEEILANIGGVTNVKVMITLDMDKAEVVDSKINLNTFPSVKGIIVTAEGINTATKMKVLHAIQAVIEITNGNIEILSSN